MTKINLMYPADTPDVDKLPLNRIPRCYYFHNEDVKALVLRIACFKQASQLSNKPEAALSELETLINAFILQDDALKRFTQSATAEESFFSPARITAFEESITSVLAKLKHEIPETLRGTVLPNVMVVAVSIDSLCHSIELAFTQIAEVVRERVNTAREHVKQDIITFFQVLDSLPGLIVPDEMATQALHLKKTKRGWISQKILAALVRNVTLPLSQQAWWLRPFWWLRPYLVQPINAKRPFGISIDWHTRIQQQASECNQPIVSRGEMCTRVTFFDLAEQALIVRERIAALLQQHKARGSNGSTFFENDAFITQSEAFKSAKQAFESQYDKAATDAEKSIFHSVKQTLNDINTILESQGARFDRLHALFQHQQLNTSLDNQHSVGGIELDDTFKTRIEPVTMPQHTELTVAENRDSGEAMIAYVAHYKAQLTQMRQVRPNTSVPGRVRGVLSAFARRCNPLLLLGNRGGQQRGVKVLGQFALSKPDANTRDSVARPCNAGYLPSHFARH